MRRSRCVDPDVAKIKEPSGWIDGCAHSAPAARNAFAGVDVVGGICGAGSGIHGRITGAAAVWRTIAEDSIGTAGESTNTGENTQLA